MPIKEFPPLHASIEGRRSILRLDLKSITRFCVWIKPFYRNGISDEVMVVPHLKIFQKLNLISILFRLFLRANYGLEWEIKIYCTTFSPFTFHFNHRISNFPPFFTNLWKKDFFSLLPGFEPGPPGWQSTMLATRPGSHDIQNCQVLTAYSNFLQILWL